MRNGPLLARMSKHPPKVVASLTSIGSSRFLVARCPMHARSPRRSRHRSGGRRYDKVIGAAASKNPVALVHSLVMLLVGFSLRFRRDYAIQHLEDLHDLGAPCERSESKKQGGGLPGKYI
jgi:hypothetical protein